MKPARILIVEDEGVIAEELSRRVTRMGLSVAAVTASGEQAVARAADSSPDLVLMDIRLTGTLDGIEAATIIRDRHQVPVVFLTAHSDDASVERAKRAAPLGYLIKPFTERDLQVTIEMALNRHAADCVALRLLETQRLESLGHLAGGVADEFSNLLVPILGNVSLAALDVEPDSQLSHYLTSISAAAEQAADLCRQMLAYSGRGNLEITCVDVNSVIWQIRELLRVAVTRQARLTYKLADDLPLIQADPWQIQQLMLNLVLNATEATQDDGAIVVRTRTLPLGATGVPGSLSAGRCVLLEVEDNGIGMDDSTRAQVFEPFFTTKPDGRGLGLAAALGIAQAHHGEIVVESTPGVGSRFRVYLPLTRHL